MKKILLFTFIFSLFAACNTGEKGEPGPAGKGFFKSGGVFSGTMHYDYPNGDTAIIPFNYNAYVSSLSQTLFLDTAGGNFYYNVNIERNDPNETENYFNIYFCDAYLSQGQNGDYIAIKPDYAFVKFKYTKTTNPIFTISNDYYNPYDDGSYASGDDFTISNYSLDLETGRIKFDYVINIPEYHIPDEYNVFNGTPAKITGSVDIILTKSTYNNSFCHNY